MITKEKIDELVLKYETEEFIKDDPIRIPNKFTEKKDIEIAGFIASLVAYGRREVFIKKLNQLLDIAQYEPYNFIMNFEPEILGDFNYRFGKPEDFAQIFDIMRNLYEKDGGLEELFKYGYQSTHPEIKDFDPSSRGGYPEFLTVGNLARYIGEELEKCGLDVKSFDNNIETSRYILDNLNAGSTIFLKASRAMKFEEIIEKLKN